MVPQLFNLLPVVKHNYLGRYKSNNHMGIGILLTGLTPPQFCACPMPDLDFQHHMWSFLCLMVWDCSFCWYWLNCWPLLVCTFFLKEHDNTNHRQNSNKSGRQDNTIKKCTFILISYQVWNWIVCHVYFKQYPV